MQCFFTDNGIKQVDVQPGCHECGLRPALASSDCGELEPIGAMGRGDLLAGALGLVGAQD